MNLGVMGGLENAGERRLHSSLAPPPELHSDQDTLAWKREYNIKQREADWKRRQEELLTQKQVQWEIQRCERENRLASAREQRRREDLEGRVCARHLEIDRRYKERCRAVEIEKRNQAWEEKENSRLIKMHDDAQAETAQRGEAKLVQKQLLFEDMRAQAADRAEKKQRDAELQRRREERIRMKEQERQAKAAEQARQLKNDAIAKSAAIVDAFTERTVPVGENSSIVGTSMARLK